MPLFPFRKKNPKTHVLFDSKDTSAPMLQPCVTLPGRATRQIKSIYGRIFLCGVAFGVTYLVLAVRLVDITLLQPKNNYYADNINFQNTPHKRHARPEILDRNGVRLAMNTSVTGVDIQTDLVWNAEETAQALAAVLPQLDWRHLAHRIKAHKNVEVRHDITDEQRAAILKLGLAGVKLVTREKRVYPQGVLAAHAIGFTAPGRGGLAGLESALDDYQEDGAMIASLDLIAQQILEEEVALARNEFQAKAAWGVVLDVATSEVIALTSQPTYNPNAPADSAPAYLRNRVLYDRYELGSAFKAITAATALEAGVAAVSSLYDVSKPLQIADRKIFDFTPKGNTLSFTDTLRYSSNIGAARMAKDLGIQKQQAYFKQLGLLDAIRTELPEFRKSAYPVHWGPVEMATISYGHGISVTPMHLATAFAAIVGDGYFRVPTFLYTNDTRRQPNQDRIFSSDTTARMRFALRQVVAEGTGRLGEAKGYYPIGKTSTADKPSSTGGYSQNARISSFVGAFPGYDPRYVILVSFDEPIPTAKTRGYATAGFVAAPVFGRIVARLGPAMGLTPVADDVAFARFMTRLRTEKDGTQNNVAKETHQATTHHSTNIGNTAVTSDPMEHLLIEVLQ